MMNSVVWTVTVLRLSMTCCYIATGSTILCPQKVAITGQWKTPTCIRNFFISSLKDNKKLIWELRNVHSNFWLSKSPWLQQATSSESHHQKIFDDEIERRNWVSDTHAIANLKGPPFQAITLQKSKVTSVGPLHQCSESAWMENNPCLHPLHPTTKCLSKK